jgi:tetratricopeptide (TPR) repeat protein/serine/threonine protein kinase
MIPARYQIQDLWVLSERLVIYEAFDRERQQPAHIWLEAVQDQTYNHRQRAKQLQTLRHAGLMPVYDHWLSQDERFYGVVVKTPGPEYVNLRQLMAGPMEPEAAVSIVWQLAQALIYAQEQAGLHFQLHPSFIRVNQEGKVKLEPYAAALETQPYQKSGVLSGLSSHTLSLSPYQSPEQALGNDFSHHPQAEVYSLGLIAYELLAGFNPFRGANDTLSRLRHQLALPPLGAANPQVGPALEEVIQIALAKNWQGRWAAVKDFLAAIETAMDGSQFTPAAANVADRLAQHRQIAREAAEFVRSRSQAGSATTPPNNEVEKTPAALALAAPKAEPQNKSAFAQEQVIPAQTKATPAPVQTAVAERPPRWRKIGLLVWFLFLVVGLILGIILSILQNNADAPVLKTTPTVANTLSPTGAPLQTPAISVTAQTSPAEESPTIPPTPADQWQPLMAEANQQIFEQGDFDKAIKTYQAMNARNPDYVPAYRQLGMALYLSGRGTTGAEAMEALKKAVTLRPDDALAWAYLAFAFHDLYQYDKGLDAANTAINLDPKLPEAHAAQALLLLRIEDATDRANESLDRATSLDSGNFWVQWVHSVILKKERNTAEAVKVIDALLNRFPRLAFLHTAKADALRSADPNRLQEAMVWYQQALQLDSTYAYAHSGLAWVYYFNGQYNQAEEAFNKALAARPGHAHSLTGLGYLKLRQRNYAGAINQFTLAIQNDPREAEAYNGLASTYLNKGDMDQVLIWANLAIKYTPRYADPFYNKGRALYEMKDYQGAITALESAVKLAPNSPEYLEALAFAYYADGKKELAKQRAQESLRLKPDNKTLNDLLKLLN